MGQRSLCLNPCNGFSVHWSESRIHTICSHRLSHLSDLTPLLLLCSVHFPLTSCLDTSFPVPPRLTRSPPPALYTFLGRPVLPIPEYEGVTAPNPAFSIPLPLVLIILDILCICFLSVFSTEMLSLWRQELGLLTVLPSRRHAAATQMFTEWMKEFLHGFICSSRPSVFERRENSLRAGEG